MFHCFRWTVVFCLLVAAWMPAWADEAASLRLVPFPKEVRLSAGTFDLSAKRALTLEAPADQAEVLARLLGEELKRAGLPAPEIRRRTDPGHFFRLSATQVATAAEPQCRSGAKEGDYALAVRPEQIACSAPQPAGLVYGMGTLCQLVRANRRGGAIPCLEIRDWPSLRWRCFQDDMTRGPSPKLDALQFEAALGASLKLNMMTYYMEYQFAFKKHPKIGPPNGSLTPEELTALVEFGRPLHLAILGNQQSFGHFGMILRHPEYAALRETADVLTPVRDETYQLLDDLYSEVCPRLPLEFFNVCCDETWGLGTGPSKELARKIGVGGVYVQHIRRVHDLLQQKHHKRMMMWGDIILQHPGHLKEIPKDTIMLTWGYDPRASFEDQILPFARSGYEFFVCPGVSNWSRILPDFGTAMVNIRHFVRDGVKHGAMGMLNTDWKDDGETIAATKWHGDAWGAECAWNAATTTPEAFNRRVGAVLFGETGDHFGQAIELLSKTHRMAGMREMFNGRFWENDFPPPFSPATVQRSACRLLAVVRPAIEHLEACRKEAVINQHVLDAILHGARRMELIAQRMLDGMEAARLYSQAYDGCVSSGPSRRSPVDALPALAKTEILVRKNRDAHEALGKQFSALWLAESKPYALDAVMHRYAGTVKRYDDLLKRLADARKAAETGKPLPRPEELGLALPEAFARRARPREIVGTPLAAATPWADPSATHRLGVIVRAGSVDRFDLPVEVDVSLPAEIAARPIRAFRTLPDGKAEEILVQLHCAEQPGRRRLVMLLPGPLAKGSQAMVHVYLGVTDAKPLPQAVSTKKAPRGMQWIENDKVRLLLGPEGGHVYRWEVKALANRDLTEPGETGWAGFCDLAGEHRSVPNRLVCTASGPALVRYQCIEPEGLTKTISLYGGASWIEVVLDESVAHYWDFDNPKNFAADGPTPGKYLFSTGATGPVGKQSAGVAAQVEGPGAQWGIKFNLEKLALSLITPETPALHHIAPGSGAGGVGIESSTPSSHFVTFGGVLETEPAETTNRMRQTLDFRHQPETVVYAVQAREKAR